jgi:hypothetical protein
MSLNKIENSIWVGGGGDYGTKKQNAVLSSSYLSGNGLKV